MTGMLVGRTRGGIALAIAALSCAHEAPPAARPAPAGEPSGGTAILLEELSIPPDETPAPLPVPVFTAAAGRFYAGRMPCPRPPDVNDPACWPVMACPNPSDPRVKRCHLPEGDLARLDPVVGRILSVTVVGSYLVIAIGVGSKQGVKIDWTATVVRGDTDIPLPGGEIEVIRIDKQIIVGRSRLTTEQLKVNPRVRFRQR